ncbi:unnamed protein product [Owenia fusiformis]|uniref:Uncharacterized protein n=1 Tax=Owenia fusiformis TaxID=6347 RepID=A0A8S4PRF7_OWEFU|nr:unnamed protein product [Owenia fusiformis]
MSQRSTRCRTREIIRPLMECTIKNRMMHRGKAFNRDRLAKQSTGRMIETQLDYTVLVDKNMAADNFISISLDDNECEICHHVTQEDLVTCDICVMSHERAKVHTDMRAHKVCFQKSHEILLHKLPSSPKKSPPPMASVHSPKHEVYQNIKGYVGEKLSWIMKYAQDPHFEESRQNIYASQNYKTSSSNAPNYFTLSPFERRKKFTDKGKKKPVSSLAQSRRQSNSHTDLTNLDNNDNENGNSKEKQITDNPSAYSRTKSDGNEGLAKYTRHNNSDKNKNTRISQVRNINLGNDFLSSDRDDDINIGRHAFLGKPRQKTKHKDLYSKPDPPTPKPTRRVPIDLCTLRKKSVVDLRVTVSCLKQHVHDVSSQLVELLQERQCAREHLDMRKVAIEQLVKMQSKSLLDVPPFPDPNIPLGDS